MRIAFVWSGLNMDGLTASEKDRFITGLKRENVEIDKFLLFEMIGCPDEAIIKLAPLSR